MSAAHTAWEPQPSMGRGGSRKTMKTQVEADATRFNPTERPPGLTPAMGSRAGSSRTDALYLEVPIRVLGTCARAEDGAVVGPAEPFDEETVTMVLLPRGAVVRLAARVTSGQDVMLLNKQINRYINCSVVKIRSSPEAKQYVEIEFTHSAPNFWGFSFPKEAARAAVAEPAVELPQRQPAEPCADAPWIVPKKALAVAAGAAGANAAAGGG